MAPPSSRPLRLPALAALGVLLAGSCAPSATGPAIRVARVERGLLPPILLAGEEPERMSLRDRMEHYRVEGLSIAVLDDFEVAWARGYGVVRADGDAPVTPDTLFQAASVSKPVAASVALRLAARGEFGLDDPVNDHLTSWRLPESDGGGSEPVRIRHLLSHSAGLAPYTFPPLAGDRTSPPLTSLLDGDGAPAVRRVEPPGRRFDYSNPGYAVLQQLLEDAGGRPFATLAREEVFEPLGMTGSSYAAPLPEPLFARAAWGHDGDGRPVSGKGMSVPAAVGGLWTTPTDLCRFLLALFSAARGRGVFLPRELVTGMLNREVEDQALGLMIAEEGEALRVFHGGGMPGFVAFLVAYPASGKGAVVMANSPGWGLLHEVLRAVAVEYGWPDYVPVHAVVSLPPEILARYAGSYQFAARPEVRPRITLRDGHLFYGDHQLFAVSETRFVIPDGGFELDFVIDPAGRVTEFRFGRPGTRKLLARRLE